jgi:hypothetical protein
MQKREVLLSVALGAACLAGSAVTGDQNATISDKDKIISKNISNNSTAASNQKAPIWPDGAKVKCSGFNSCKGKGACKGAANSCAGQNGCKGKGWIETTAKECKDKKGKIIIEDSNIKDSK